MSILKKVLATQLVRILEYHLSEGDFQKGCDPEQDCCWDGSCFRDPVGGLGVACEPHAHGHSQARKAGRSKKLRWSQRAQVMLSSLFGSVYSSCQQSSKWKMALLEPELIFHEMGGVCDSRRCGDEPCDPQLLDGFDILWTEFLHIAKQREVAVLLCDAVCSWHSCYLKKNAQVTDIYDYVIPKTLLHSIILFANLIVLRDYNNNKFIVYSTIWSDLPWNRFVTNIFVASKSWMLLHLLKATQF